LYNLTLPKLYEKVIINSESENDLETLNTEPFLRGNSLGRLQHVKHVLIAGTFREKLIHRCVHSSGPDENGRYLPFDFFSSSAKKQANFQKLATNAVEVLEKLEEGSLKSFRQAIYSL
jgi:hypothetical protein